MHFVGVGAGFKPVLFAYAMGVSGAVLPSHSKMVRTFKRGTRDTCSFRRFQHAHSRINWLRFLAYNPVMQDAKLVVIQSCGSQIEAELVKGALEAAGIDAMIQADTAGRMREHLAWSGAGFKILVREEDATAARDLLASPPEADENAGADSDGAGDPPPTSRRFT